jgi:uncharacterized protein (TIGR00251 family)
VTPAAITATATGIRIRIHLQPGASKTETVGRHGDALRVRVATPPIEGRANDALIRYVAARRGVPRRAVEIVAGLASRRKVIEVTGIGVAAAASALFGNESSD